MVRHFLQNLLGFGPQVRRDSEFLRPAGFCHGFAVARIELSKPIGLAIARWLILIAVVFRACLQFAENGPIIVPPCCQNGCFFVSPARSIDCINQGLCHGFAVARIELDKPIDLQLACCLTLIALCFEIACSLLNMEPSLF